MTADFNQEDYDRLEGQCPEHGAFLEPDQREGAVVYYCPDCRSELDTGRSVPCKACGAQIKWITTRNKKRMPVDIGVTSIVTKDGITIQGHRPHWATCPDGDQFRKPPDSVNDGRVGKDACDSCPSCGMTTEYRESQPKDSDDTFENWRCPQRPSHGWWWKKKGTAYEPKWREKR